MTRTEDNDTFSRPRMDLTGSLCRIRQREAAVRQGYDETAGFGLKYLSFFDSIGQNPRFVSLPRGCFLERTDY